MTRAYSTLFDVGAEEPWGVANGLDAGTSVSETLRERSRLRAPDQRSGERRSRRAGRERARGHRRAVPLRAALSRQS